MVGVKKEEKYKGGFTFLRVLVEDRNNDPTTARELTAETNKKIDIYNKTHKNKMTHVSPPTTYSYMDELKQKGYVAPIAISGTTCFQATPKGIQELKKIKTTSDLPI